MCHRIVVSKSNRQHTGDRLMKGTHQRRKTHVRRIRLATAYNASTELTFVDVATHRGTGWDGSRQVGFRVKCAART